MENATKALVMAGGVLIAIMTIATLLYAANMWGVFPSTKDESDFSEQLAKFNQQYEAYNKKALYGTDIVSVLNKAVDNNNDITKEEKDTLFINVKIELISNVVSRETTYKIYADGTQEEDTKYGDKPLLKANTPYSLDGNNTVALKDFLTNFINNSGKISSTKPGNELINGENKKYQQYTVTSVENSEFKIKVFECVEVGYNEIGRINYMYFKEVNPSK